MSVDLGSQQVIEIRRRAFFEASHRYWIDAWTPDENRRRFGRCASAHGHGHNYVVDVAVVGPLDPRTGMALDLRDLDAALDDVLSELDHRFLNADVPAFRSGCLPSVECLATYVRRRVEAVIRRHSGWSEIQVREAVVSEGYPFSYVPLGGTGRAADGGPDCAGPRGTCCLTTVPRTSRPGDYPPMDERPLESISLTRSYTFSAAHRLHEPALGDEANRELFGKCNNPNGHGHTYQLDVTVSGTPDRTTGMVVDLAELDRAVEEHVLSRVDHRHLNLDVAPFDQLNPTSENVVRVIWEWLEPVCPAQLESLTLHETFRSSFTLRRHG